MGIAVWIVARAAQPEGPGGLSVVCLAYFGFYREGCICPIGSIQNVAVSLTDPRYSIPIVVTAIFFLPLAGRAVLRPRLLRRRLPAGRDSGTGRAEPVAGAAPAGPGAGPAEIRLPRAGHLLRGASRRPAATSSSAGSTPSSGFFRRTGAAHMLVIGGGVPAGRHVRGPALLPLPVPVRRAARAGLAAGRRGVTITPDKELDCGLCRTACPYGAIEKKRAVGKPASTARRCYASCPVDDGDRRATAAVRPARMKREAQLVVSRRLGVASARRRCCVAILASPPTHVAALWPGAAREGAGSGASRKR